MDDHQQQKGTIMTTVVGGQTLETHFVSIESRLANNEDKVSELFASQARLESNDQAILSRLDLFSEQMHDFNRQLSTPKPFNTVGWITTALLILSLIGGFGMVVLTPMSGDIKTLQDYQDIDTGKRLDQVFELGKQTAELKELKHDMNSLMGTISEYRKECSEDLTSSRISFNDRIIKLESKLDLFSNRIARGG